MTIDRILSRLDRVRQTGAHRWTARCPAHEDRGPSLALADEGGKILIHCFAGCEPLSVVEAIGLQLTDLFPEPLPASKSFRRPFPAADILACLAEESKIVYLVGRDLREDKYVNAADWDRFKVAVARIEAAMEVANG